MSTKRKYKLKDIHFTDKLAFMGTGLLLVAPYLLGYTVGFILAALGLAMLTPQVYKANQWNLVLLNVVSFIGYVLQAVGVL
tara:strand:+ start:156 stop:398 length:243 start_codon:yes stop_codon:yes gene_type:complete